MTNSQVDTIARHVAQRYAPACQSAALALLQGNPVRIDGQDVPNDRAAHILANNYLVNVDEMRKFFGYLTRR